MDYTIRENGKSREIVLSGSFNFADNEKVRDLVDAFGAGRKDKAVLSLELLKSIDSAGLGMLVVLNDAAKQRDISFSIKGARGQVKKMLEIIEFDTLVRVEA